MNALQIAAVFSFVALAALLFPQKASAHCDTMDGPTAKDGRKALTKMNVNYAEKWVAERYEVELGEAFTLALKVRALGDDARTLADRYFLENLVRLHRAGEGEPFTGVKPEGTPIDAKIAAADKAIEVGSLAPLEGMVEPEEKAELNELLTDVLQKKSFDVDDVAAGREYIEAYVSFFKTAEGEAHEAGSYAGHVQ